MGKRVLIVDDAIFMRVVLKDILLYGGYEIVGEASNGVEAVEKYKLLRPDLTTMDLIMPFKNGIEATRDILAFDENALILMVSGVGQEALVLEAIEVGMKDFIVKPPIEKEVLAVIKKVLK